MSQTPLDPSSPRFVAYPRAKYRDDVHKLQMLADGYFGLTWSLVANFALALAANYARSLVSEDSSQTITSVSLVGIGMAVALLTYGPNRKIGEALGWSREWPVIASILMGLNSALWWGVVGFVVMQQIAANAINRYGVVRRSFGIRRSDVNRRIAYMQSYVTSEEAPLVMSDCL